MNNEEENNKIDENKIEIKNNENDDTYYYIDSGLRYIKPYEFIYKTGINKFKKGTKKRWIGKKLKEVYQKDFPYYKEDYIVNLFLILE
jgi:hypothetical protein